MHVKYFLVMTRLTKLSQTFVVRIWFFSSCWTAFQQERILSQYLNYCKRQYLKTIVMDIKDTKSTICWRARPNVKLMGEFSSTTGLQVFILNKYFYLPVFLILHFFIGHFYWPFLIGHFFYWLHIKYYKSNPETFQGCCRPSLSHSIGVVLQALQVILKFSEIQFKSKWNSVKFSWNSV